jgi:hypothetical protein
MPEMRTNQPFTAKLLKRAIDDDKDPGFWDDDQGDFDSRMNYIFNEMLDQIRISYPHAILDAQDEYGNALSVKEGPTEIVFSLNRVSSDRGSGTIQLYKTGDVPMPILNPEVLDLWKDLLAANNFIDQGVRSYAY